MAYALDLSGQVALVTGGNRGIGRSIVLGLAEAGADIAIAARDEQATATVVDEVTRLGRRAIGIGVDLSRSDGIDATVERTVAELGKLSILVNNAGISRHALPQRMSEEDWDIVLDTNLKAAFLLAKAAYPALTANGGGKIINIASPAGLMGTFTQAGYGASKAGMINLTKTLAMAWGRRNIQVNALLPGVIRTDMWQDALTDEMKARILPLTPAGRVGEPEDVAGAAVFLASSAASFITGETLIIDGGVMSANPMGF